MSRVRPPDDIQIASLRKKQQTVFDPMKAGTGTPWEDRGSHGLVGAFFKTCFASMLAPGKLTASIRRPETITDARGFLIGICGIWGMSGLMHYAYFVWRETQDPNALGVIEPNMIILGVLTLALSGGGAYFLFLIYTKIYGILAAQEKGTAVLPDVLIYNVSAYAVGPSLLALIPFAGPFLAAIWIFVTMISAGSSRLQLKTAAAVIDSLLSLLVVMAIPIGFYYIVERGINGKLVNYDAVDMKEVHVTAGSTAAAPTP